MTWLKKIGASHALKNWQTTLAGALTLAATGYAVYRDPASIANPQTLGAITAGLGLIRAADANKPPTAPAQ